MSSPSRTAILLRESRREGRKIKCRTLANLSRLLPYPVEAIRLELKGSRVVSDPGEAFVIRRALVRGDVCAVPGLGNQLGLHAILSRRASRKRDLALAAIAACVLEPGLKLATARRLSPATASSSLRAVLGLVREPLPPHVDHHDSALATWSSSKVNASLSAHGLIPTARSTLRISPTMPTWAENMAARPFRSTRMTSKPLIEA